MIESPMAPLADHTYFKHLSHRGVGLSFEVPRHGMSPSIATLVILALLTGCIASCSEPEPAMILAIRARTQLSTLYVRSKQYHNDGRVTVYTDNDFPIEPDWDGYVLSVDGDPLRMRIDVPEPGRYAIHLIGVPIGAIEADPSSDRYIATICRDVDDIVAVTDVYLGRLTRGHDSLDVDSDTFPESLEAFCASQANVGMPCDTSCNTPDYLAMVDCNPPEDFEVPSGCGTIGGPEMWNPFTTDTCGDCLDQDCYGGDAYCIDFDEDGYPENVDCNDREAAINPGVAEICGNRIDENCAIDIEACINGDVPCDDDGDGFLALQEDLPGCGVDCNDSNAAIHPDVYEGLGSDPDAPLERVNCDDGIDNNCNGRIDERCENDLDADGVELDLDCNDCNASVGPGFVEVCGNGIDEDCDGVDPPCSPNDQDGDGYEAEPIGTDCDDDDRLTFPGAADRCGDGIAQNCALDQECRSDDDGDSFDVGDCDEENAGVNPWAIERCDSDGDDMGGIDDDCDGQLNEVPWELAESQGCGFETTEGGWRIIDYDSDIDHCGECRHACWLGSTHREGDHCVDGACMCFELGHGCYGDVTNYCCEDGCQDIGIDEEHCGSCTDACAEYGDEECRATGPGGRGECHCVHEEDLRRCISPFENACCPEVGCTNANSDVHNCGACGHDCMENDPPGPRGDICTPNADGDPTCHCGAVGVLCTGTTWCTGVGPDHAAEGSCGCRDLNTDWENCGSCDFECDENESCVDAACWCESASTNCEGSDTNFCCPNASSCVNLMTDEEHCGDCFAPHCRPGEACDNGSCHCNGGSGCTDSQVCCPGRGCTNVLNDEGNCGPATDLSGCGNACNSGVECENGFCSCGAGGDCGGGETCCFGSYCSALSSDADNCGECGTECFDGEECVGGDCVCGADCADGNSCTEDSCVDERCEHVTLDNDNDGYCGAGCRDQDSGGTGDCINGDCDDNNADAYPGNTENCDTVFDDDCDGGNNDLDADRCDNFYRDDDDDTYGDESIAARCQCRASGDYTADRALDCDDSNPSINPSGTDICNGLNDDCDGGTEDGSADCAGGAAFCCGSPRSCRSCCTESQCPGMHPACLGYSCGCASGWENCGGTCNCGVSSGQVCCSSTCYDGSCCDDGDCSSGEAPDCNTSSHSCACIGGIVCGGNCLHGATCCGDGDCSGATPNCCSNQCYECCNAADCGGADWNCSSHACTCTGIVCGGECWEDGVCCDAADCPGGLACLPDHTCAV